QTEARVGGFEHKDAPCIRDVAQQFAPQKPQRRTAVVPHLGDALLVPWLDDARVQSQIGSLDSIIYVDPRHRRCGGVAQPLEPALQAARNILVGGAGPAQQAQRELDAIMPLRQREFAILAEAVESAERRRLGPERRRRSCRPIPSGLDRDAFRPATAKTSVLSAWTDQT